MGNFTFLTMLYFIYQAAFGGLFLLVGKSLQSYNHYPLLLALFASAEPLLIIIFGIQISKKIDDLRNMDAAKKTCSYLYLTAATMLSFFMFSYFFVIEKSLLMGTIAYFLVALSFSAERIYRQRFPRDYSVSFDIHLHRINSINNLVTRGTPIATPFILMIFTEGFSFNYHVTFILSAISASLMFSYFFCKTNQISSMTKVTIPKITNKNEERWGQWHVIHLSLMNFAFGGMFLVLAQPILNEISLRSYLQSPVPLYTGFLIAMITIAFGYAKKPGNPLEGLNLVVIMGGLLMTCSICPPILCGSLLFVYGILFAFAINKIGTCIQQNLDHNKYSYYETRAQTYGRVTALISIAMYGYLLDKGISFQKLEFLLGITVLISAIILKYFYRIIIEEPLSTPSLPLKPKQQQRANT